MDPEELRENVAAARQFDRKLKEIQRIVCMPSNLGGGSKTQLAFDEIKTTSCELLKIVRQLNTDVEHRNKQAEEKIGAVQDWIDDLSKELNRVEEIGKENGLVPLND